MKFQRALVVAMAGVALTLGGCTGGDEAAPLPPVEIPALAPEPQPFRTGTSFADGVLGIDVRTPDGRTRTLDTAVAVSHPDRTVVSSAGTWQGQFSNRPDVDGNPRRVVGSTDVPFAEDDGSHGRLTGIFDALTPATVTPPDFRPSSTVPIR